MRTFLFALMLFGCGDTDCPETIDDGSSCSSAGLTCLSGLGSCSCDDGKWQCVGDADLRFTHD